MKLLYCTNCDDVFKLKLDEMRYCECKKVFGRYINNVEAEVSEDAISLAIGNGSLMLSISEMMHTRKVTNDQAPRGQYYIKGSGKIEYAWVRPNEGVGNPHCKVIKNP